MKLMTSWDKKEKIDCAHRLRQAYERMRLLHGVQLCDTKAMIDTWEHLEKEVRVDDNLCRAMARRELYPDWREW